MRTLLLTGATGALGLPLLAELLARPQHDRIFALVRGDATALTGQLARHYPQVNRSTLTIVPGNLEHDDGLAALATIGPVNTVLHLAASTKFRAPDAMLAAINVEGTRRLLEWAQHQSPAPRFIHFSTTCAAGRRTGEIAEKPLLGEQGFVNAYERTKWTAESLVLASRLRPEIVRLATVVGSATDGGLHRPGAFHTTLRWLHAGLLPMIPGNEETRLDLLHTELVADFITRLLARPAQPQGIYHLSRGAQAVPLAALLDLGTEKFSAANPAWRSGQIVPPVLATRAAFDDFRTSIAQSRDFLFNQVLESVDSFLPELFYPKRYQTRHAEEVFGGPLPFPDWHPWLGRVIDSALASDFGRREIAPAPSR